MLEERVEVEPLGGALYPAHARALICCFPPTVSMCVHTQDQPPNRLSGCLEEPNKEHESPHRDSTMKLLSSSRVVHLLLQLAANIRTVTARNGNGQMYGAVC